MKHIKVECPDLVEAFESNHPGVDYFLNMESGEVIKLPEDFCPDETISGIDYFSDPQYLRIPKISNEKGLQIRKEYLDFIEKENLSDRLEKVLMGRGSLKRFVDTLRAYPEYYEQWLAFKNKRLLETISVWIEALDVEIELINRSFSDDII